MANPTDAAVALPAPFDLPADVIAAIRRDDLLSFEDDEAFYHFLVQLVLAWKYIEPATRAPAREGGDWPAGYTVTREKDGSFPDVFVVKHGTQESHIIRGEDNVLWGMFDAALSGPEAPPHTPDCRSHDDASVCDCGALVTPRG